MNATANTANTDTLSLGDTVEYNSRFRHVRYGTIIETDLNHVLPTVTVEYKTINGEIKQETILSGDVIGKTNKPQRVAALFPYLQALEAGSGSFSLELHAQAFGLNMSEARQDLEDAKQSAWVCKRK